MTQFAAAALILINELAGIAIPKSASMLLSGSWHRSGKVRPGHHLALAG